MPRQPHLHVRVNPSLLEAIDRVAAVDGTGRTAATVKILHLGLEGLGGGRVLVEEGIDASLERLEALNDRLTAVENGLATATAEGLADLYRKQLRFFENLIAWEVEILMLLRISIGGGAPQLVADAQKHAHEFLVKKYAQFGLDAPATAPARRA
jgi:hypothetical protein